MMNKWVKVEDALPPLKQRVLLWCYGRICYGLMDDPDGYNGYPLFQICDSVDSYNPIVFETTEHSELTKGKVSAWMPLPEPPIKPREDCLKEFNIWDSEMSRGTIRMLLLHGFKTLDDINGLSVRRLLEISGLGEKGIHEIRMALQGVGGDLKD